MSDERLLSEALRAHAAGGVSTPRADTSAPSAGAPTADAGSGAPPAGRRRFRPLGRVRRPDQAPPDQTPPGQTPPGRAPSELTPPDQPPPTQPPTDQPWHDQPRADQAVPSPRSGGPGLPPPGYARGPILAAPPTAPVRSTSGGGRPGAPAGIPRPAARPDTAGPAPRSAMAGAGYVPWSAVTVTWWSLVGLLAGGVVGGAIGVLSLLLPA